MVKRTILIKEEHAEAFLNFIKTLDYVQVDEGSITFELSDAQKERDNYHNFKFKSSGKR